jgi:hypothetical protein
MARRLKLRLELVPKPLYGRNLRSETEGIGRARWKRLRLQAIEACGGKCIICEGTDKLHGHEVWKYDEKKTVGTVTLLKVDAVCRTCHNISHWGNTSLMISAGLMKRETHLLFRRHFRRINRCRQAEFDRHILSSFAEWRRRSKKKWKVDWGPFAPLVAEAVASRARRRERNAESSYSLDGQ